MHASSCKCMKTIQRQRAMQMAQTCLLLLLLALLKGMVGRDRFKAYQHAVGNLFVCPHAKCCPLPQTVLVQGHTLTSELAPAAAGAAAGPGGRLAPLRLAQPGQPCEPPSGCATLPGQSSFECTAPDALHATCTNNTKCHRW